MIFIIARERRLCKIEIELFCHILGIFVFWGLLKATKEPVADSDEGIRP